MKTGMPIAIFCNPQPYKESSLCNIQPTFDHSYDPGRNDRHVLVKYAAHRGRGWWKRVHDPFAGSGTTLYVAEQYGRDSIGIELSEEYCKLIHKRMDKMQMNIFSLEVSE
jgi:hypothetical protein